MRLQDNTDFTTLTWVKPELDETLRQARNALQNYVEEGESPAELRTCSELLHQVQGTLRMVELYGAAMVAEEMEQLSRALIDAKVDDRDSAYAALMQGIVQLPDYLERLQSGHRDIPIVLLPLLNNLRESRGEKGLNESVLFSPDLSRELPPSAHGPQTPMDPKELGRRAEMLRSLYQGALLRWLKDDNSPATIRDLTDVCEQLVPITWAEPARRLFWVAAGTLDALGKNAFPISNPLKQALAKVEREIKRLAEGGDAAFRVDPPIELTKQLLYFVAHEGTDDGRIGEIRSVFGLSGSGPSEAELAHARGSLSGNNRALLETVAVAIKEDLLRVKDALDLHLRTPGASLDDLSVQADALDRVADTLGMLGLGVPRRVVQDQRSAINDVISGQRKDNEDTLLDIAGALLYVEAALDDQVERLGKEEVQAPGSTTPTAPSNESRRLLEVLVKEAIVNFAEARQSFVAFVETHWDHAQLAEVPRLLTEVTGALRILELPEPADYLAGVRQFTENELLQRKQVPNGQQMDRLADALASLEYYLEALRDRRPNREQILEVARQSLASLGYWPLHAESRPQTLADAVPSPSAPVLASVAPAQVPAPVASTPAPVEAVVAPVAVPEPPAAAPARVEPVQVAAPVAAKPVAAPTPVTAASAASAAADAPVVPGFDGSSGEEIDDEIREVFLEEFEEEIENLAQLLPAWRQDPVSAELLRPIRRVFHTLKGSGRLVGARTLGEFSWKVESLLNRVLDGSRPASPQVIAMVQLSLDTLPLLRAALAGEEVRADLEGMQSTAEQLAAGEEVTYSTGVVEPVPETADAEVAKMDEPEQPFAPEHEKPEAAEPEPELETASGLGFSIDPVLLEILKPEVAGHLEVVDAWLAQCAARGPQPVTDPLVRSIHTMNGAFAMTELVVITDVTAPLEGFVKRSLAHNLTPSAEGIALVSDAANAIRETILAIGKPRPVLPQFDALSARAHALRDSLPDAGRPSMPVHADEESGAMPQVVMMEAADVSAIPDFASDAVTVQSAATTFDTSEPADGSAAEIAAAEIAAAEERAAEERAEAERAAEERAAEARAAEERAAEERAAEERAAEASAAEARAAEERAAEERAAEERAAEERAAEERAAEARAAEERAAEARAAEALAAEASITEEPAFEALAFEETAFEATPVQSVEELPAAAEFAAEDWTFEEPVAEASSEAPMEMVASDEAPFAADELAPAEAEERQEIAEAFESQAEIEARAARAREEEEFARGMEAVAEDLEEPVAHAEFPESELLSLEAFLRGPAQPAAAFSMDEAPEQAPDSSTMESPSMAIDESPAEELSVQEQAPADALWVEEREPVEAAIAQATEPFEVEALSSQPVAESHDSAETPQPVLDVAEDADAALASMIGAFESDEQLAELHREEPADEAPVEATVETGIFTPQELAGADQLLEPVATADEGYYGLTLDELEAMTAPAAATEAELPVQVAEIELAMPVVEPALDEAEAEPALEEDTAPAPEVAEVRAVESDGFAELPSIGDVPAWTPMASEQFDSEEPAVEIVTEPEIATQSEPQPELPPEPEPEPEPEPVAALPEFIEPQAPAPVNEAELLFDDEDEDEEEEAIQDEQPVAEVPQPVAAVPAAPQAPAGRPRVPMARDAADPDENLDLTDLDTELLDLFLEESNDILDHSDGMLARLRDHADDRDSIINLQRDLHTLKGGARMAGIYAVGELGHAMESLLESVAEGRQRLDATGVVVLERGFDRLHGMVARIGERKAIALPSGLIAQVEALSEGKSLEEAGDAAPEAGEAVVATPQPARADVAAPAMAPLTAPVEEMAGEEEMTGVRAPQEQVRIRADLLDRLVNYAGEVAIYRARLEQQLGAFRANLGELDQTTTRLREQLRRLDIETEAQIVARYQREGESDDERFDPLELDRFTNQQQLTRALNESANDLVNLQGVLDELTRQYETLLLQQSRVSSDLQEGLMRTRMVPFDALVPRLRRVLRQAATDTGKQVQLKVDGASGEMDRNVLERMTAPLEHMLRNAMAHGLELPEDRRKARKPEEGMVRIAVQREGSEVVLKVTDDGRGLDKEAIRRKAIERGLIKPDAELADEALYGMILESGFSTAETVSRLSGRGVGMDVVYSEIRQLGGTLQIRSEQGKGSEFIIRLPFTLAVTQAVFVKIGETSFAVPIASVRGVGRIARADLDKQLASENPVFNYAGEDYAIHDLGHLIGHAPAKAQDSLQMPLLLARSGDLRTAISIDQVLGSREIVVKPVGPQVNSVPGIFGATIMGDGRVVVILDVAPLVRRHMAVVREAAPVVLAPVIAARRVPVVMVVDDSITMRKVTGRVLERNNMEVLTAKDGVDAVEKMAERVPDLVLLDIEMPRMDGYEVAQNMRSDPRLKDVPIIMITSRTGDKHRQRAMDIGVNRYLGKPYQEPELMRNVFEMLGMESVHG